MHGHVLPQAGVGGESLVAHLAAEWPLARVAPDVDAQRLLVPAAVAAALAHEVLLLRVHLAVVAPAPMTGCSSRSRSTLSEMERRKPET